MHGYLGIRCFGLLGTAGGLCDGSLPDNKAAITGGSVMSWGESESDSV